MSESFTDNKKFWKTVKPLSSDKQIHHRKITLIENHEMTSNEANIVNVVEKLELEGYSTDDIPLNLELNTVSNIITKFKDHPSILNIRENVLLNETFHFSMISEAAMSTEIKSLNKTNPTTYTNIPIKILIDSCEISSPSLTAVYDDSILKCTFPSTLKQADITPDKGNYRPVSILPSVSKLFERTMHDQISYYIDKHLTPY